MMRLTILRMILMTVALGCAFGAGPASAAASDLRVNANGRYLEKGDGTPFFFLSDTEWVLNERTDSEVTTILNDRAAKGFTVVQVFATRSWVFDGSGDVSTDVNGNHPFVNNEPTQLNAAYWDRWRWVADRAAERGLYFLLVYGEPGRTDPPWRCSSGAACYEYGRRVGDWFKDKSNVIFCDGYDSSATSDTGLWQAMAEGVADGVNGVNSYDGSADYGTTLMTYHGYGIPDAFHYDGWLDFYGTEVWGNIAGLYDTVNSTYNLTNPTKPIAILEANYEGYPYPDYYTTAYWVRVQVWHIFFAGGMGYGYGNNWNYHAPATTTLDYLASEGAADMQVFATFMRARNWWKLVPDQSIVSNPGSGVSRKAAVRSTDGDECLVYYPSVESVTIDMGCITATSSVAATWFDPRNGGTQDAGDYARTQQVAMRPPGGWQDAVLVLTAADGGPPPPPPPPVGSCGAPGDGSFTGCYYDNSDFTNLKVSRGDSTINFDWGGGSPDPSIGPNTFSVRWQGNFSFNAGDYQFTTTADDGVRVYLDGSLIIDQWRDQGPTTYTATRTLSAGSHLVTMEYYENGGGATAKLSWAPSGTGGGATNLASNPGFESGTSPWYDAINVVSSNAHGGAKAASFTTGNATHQAVTLPGNKSCTLTVWAKVTSGHGYVGINSFGGTDAYQTLSSASYAQSTPLTFNTGTSSSYTADLWFWTDVGAGYVDDFSITCN